MTLDAIFNGVQETPGHPDQWVFTDRLTGATFYTDAGVTYEVLLREMQRVRRRFLASAKQTGAHIGALTAAPVPTAGGGKSPR
jgi:hypothetical protein